MANYTPFEIYADVAEKWLNALYGMCDLYHADIDLRLISSAVCMRLQNKRHEYQTSSTGLDYYRGLAEYQEIRVIDLRNRAYEALKLCQRVDARSTLSHWLADNPAPIFPAD